MVRLIASSAVLAALTVTNSYAFQAVPSTRSFSRTNVASPLQAVVVEDVVKTGTSSSSPTETDDKSRYGAMPVDLTGVAFSVS